MPAVSLSDIISFVSGRFGGDANVTIEGVLPLSEAGERHISFLSNPKYASQVETTRAAAVLVAEDLAGDDPRWIRVANPYIAMARVVARFFAGRPVPQGISPQASIANSAKLGANVHRGGVEIGLSRGDLLDADVLRRLVAPYQDGVDRREIVPGDVTPHLIG